MNEIRATDDSNYPLFCDKRQALASAVPEFVVLFRVNNIRVPMLAAQDSTGVAKPFEQTFAMRRATGGRWLTVADLPPGTGS